MSAVHRGSRAGVVPCERREGGGDRSARSLLHDPGAQATVEMAVVVPVLIVLALIVYNILLFVAAAARFDRVAPDVVIAHAVSPPGPAEALSGGATEEVRRQLEMAMEGYDVTVDVTCAEDGDSPGESIFSLVGAQRTYRCTMHMATWPGPLSIAGVDLGAPVRLSHEREVTIDPWRPGVVM